MNFTLRATGGLVGVDRTELVKALPILIADGSFHEVRALWHGREHMGARSIVIQGGQWDTAIGAIEELAMGTIGVYFTLNPVRGELATARTKTGYQKSATDKDILERRWLLLDFDRKKQAHADDMATNEEKAAAMKLTAEVHDWLCGQGWPPAVMTDSGNGGHLLYRIDLPNDDLSKVLIAEALKALAKKFETAHADIDTKVFNASRISKLPGTWVRKGISTDERPHRIAKIVCWPDADQFVCVTQEQLHALAGTSGKRDSSYNPWVVRVPHTTDRLARYVMAIIERGIGKIFATAEGNRNNVLYQVAATAGNLMAANLYERAKAESDLLNAAMKIGLSESESKKTIASGIDGGLKEPIKIPPDILASVRGSSANGKPSGTSTPAKRTVKASQIKPQKVNWIWENRIAIGFISIFGGKTSVGKSFVLLDAVSSLSRCKPIAYSSIQPKVARSCLYISEDPPEFILVPRLMELKADLDRVHFLTWDSLSEFTLENTTMLDEAWGEMDDPLLLVIDPPANFLGDVDEHRNSEVRQLLKALVAWINKVGAGCVFVTHLNKATTLDAVDRFIGSVAWSSSARFLVGFARDPDNPDQFVFGGLKNNVGPEAAMVSYRIVSVDGDPDRAKIEWLGMSEASISDAINQVKRKSRGKEAVEFITRCFENKREWLSDDLWTAAQQHGLTRNAVFKSDEIRALPIWKRKRLNAEGEEKWYWTAKEGWPTLFTESTESKSEST
jgi:hypothetical protein